MIYTRMTTRSLNETVLQSMYSNTAKLNDLQHQISSGKRVEKPSDDAAATIDILSSNSSINKIDIYKQNIDKASSETEMTDQVLANVTESIQRVNELAVQASNATTGPDELKSINEEIKQIMNTIADAANTQFGDKYIFAGTKTSTAPFKVTDTGEVIYNGTPSSENYKRSVEISKGIEADINLPGDDVFGYYKVTSAGPPEVTEGKGLFQTMATLSKELVADPPDYDAIRSKVDDLGVDLQTVLNSRAKIGGTSTKLTMTKSKLENDSLNYEKFKTSAEGIDLAKAISDMSFQETALQASMQVSAKMLNGNSLMNYL